jgi:hypothetical protein
MIFEDNQQRRQRRLVVVAPVLARVLRIRCRARKLGDGQYMFDPPFVAPITVPNEHSPVVESPVIGVILECLADALRQCPFYFREFVLPRRFPIVGLSVFFQPLLILFGIAIVVNSHHAIERLDQRPVEGCAKSFGLAFERCKGQPNLEISAPAATD